jgi:hypothetical protein
MWSRLIPWGIAGWLATRSREIRNRSDRLLHRGHRTSSLILSCLGSAALGAGLMYMLDPAVGRRRRTIAREKVTSAAHKASDVVTSKARHARNVAQGLAHKVTQQAEEISVPS